MQYPDWLRIIKCHLKSKQDVLISLLLQKRLHNPKLINTIVHDYRATCTTTCISDVIGGLCDV